MKYIEQRNEAEDRRIGARTRSNALRHLCDEYGTMKIGRRVYVKTEETDTTPDGDVVDVAFRMNDYSSKTNIVPLYIVTGGVAYYAGAWYDVVTGETWYDYEFTKRAGLRWDGEENAEGCKD